MGELNISGNADFLKMLLPAGDLKEADLAALKYLVLKFPYSQPLHFAYAAALKTADPSQYNEYLTKASAYAPRREVLQSFIENPGSFHFYEFEAGEEEDTTVEAQEFVAETAASEVLVVPEEPILIAESVEIETVVPEAEMPELQFSHKDNEEQEPVVEEMTDTVEAAAEQDEGRDNGVQDAELQPEESLASEEDRSADAEQIRVDSVASRDYFVFNRSVIDPRQEEEKTEAGQVVEVAVAAEDTQSDVSKYNDETMPYTFLWWLHKTRKEYSATYQPYVRNYSSDLKKGFAGELNQQIIENIFHIQPELNTFQAAEIATTVEFELKKKEDEIIEKFIREEPQIRPPQAVKLDTENKARKSSEDNFDLVSETLAKIYTDQMLYHKAIEIYRKLSLKFPDKKLYFAGQIQELEKKIS